MLRLLVTNEQIFVVQAFLARTSFRCCADVHEAPMPPCGIPCRTLFGDGGVCLFVRRAGRSYKTMFTHPDGDHRAAMHPFQLAAFGRAPTDRGGWSGPVTLLRLCQRRRR